MIRRAPAAVLLLALVLAGTAHAQIRRGTTGLPMARPTTAISTLGVFQQFEGETGLDGSATQVTQWSVPVAVTVSTGPNLGLGLRANYTASSGDGMAPLNRLSDVEVSASGTRALGAGRVVTGLAVDLPVSPALTPAEIGTAFMVGQTFYGFQTPNTERGISVSPSVLWAGAVSERLAVGAGLSYQYRGAFEPRVDEDASYDPGDELLVTAGLDYQLSPSSVVALDLAYARYATDVWGDLSYDPGDALSVAAEWQTVSGWREVGLAGLVRRRSDRTVPAETAALLGLSAVPPTEAGLHGLVRVHLGRRLSVGATAGARYYAESEVFTAMRLVDLGIEQTLLLRDDVALVGRFRETFGDLHGVEAVVGLSFSL